MKFSTRKERQDHEKAHEFHMKGEEKVPKTQRHQ